MTVDQSLEVFGDVWSPIVERACNHGVKIAIENSTETAYWSDQWPGGNNLASSPHIWRRMFEVIPSAHLGLNLDPSHLVLQAIDYVRAVNEFGDRVLHVHAKDETLDRDGLYEYGAFALGLNVHVGRVPGRGVIDWAQFIGALHNRGYRGTISIELEDSTFEKDDEDRKRGLLIGRDVVRPYVK